MVKRSTENLQKNLTDNQKDVLNFIKTTCEKTGVPPTYREIQAHFGYKAVGTVQDHVRALIQKGALEKSTKKARTARGLLPPDSRLEGVKKISIYGEIAAGPTRLSEELKLGALVIDSTLSKNPSFALRVVGNSMIEVGMYEGDVLVVEKDARVSNGDIIVALVDGETTVKRYEKKSGKIFLVPENKTMKPIEITTQNFEIQGKVVGLQRKI